jgi:acyl carrier protein
MSADPLAVERVHRILTEDMHLDVPTIGTDLLATGVLDSLALVELLFQIEQEFGVSVSLDGADLEGFRTIGGICEVLSLDTGSPRPGS